MYESYYGVKERPFSLLPDPEYLLLGRKHRIAYTLLEYALTNPEAFTVITGEIGCGKTTLIRHLLKSAGPLVTFGFISDTIRLKGEILERVLLAFGLDVSTGGWTEKYQRFSEFALKEYAQGRRVVVVVDEAQNMDRKALEELRVLSNVNAEKHLLVQVILAGQPELRQKLQDPKLEQFRQRIGKLYHLLPLDEQETREYIAHRITVAGGNPDIFSEEACASVYRESRGVPRIVNQLCDTALVYGYGLQKDVIDSEVIDEVIGDRAEAWTVTASSAREEDILPEESYSRPEPSDPDYSNDEDSAEPASTEDGFGQALVLGWKVVDADDEFRDRFGLPEGDRIAEHEWLDIISDDERDKVREVYRQYWHLGSPRFTFTASVQRCGEKPMNAQLQFNVTRVNGRTYRRLTIAP